MTHSRDLARRALAPNGINARLSSVTVARVGAIA